VIAALLLAASAPASVDPVVPVAQGQLRGTRMADGRALFRGIPFAAPPVGPLRWRPPAPAATWSGIRDARTSAPSCPQPNDGWNAANAASSAEDCLYLEVGTPSTRLARPLPVMVWIHGGSNRAGGAQGTVSSSLVTRGVVLVSVQYRLGALGFMAHRALSAESPHHASGNYGLMDQQAALRWVRRNIAAFGGDPRNVTVFGESAGAQDVGLQQVSPRAAGLFDKAIEQSGTPGFGWAPRTLAASEVIGEQIAAGAGAPHADAAALRALPVAAVLAASAKIPTPPGLPEPGTVWLQITIDGWVIAEPPATTLARGGGQRVPLIIGSNLREISFYADAAQARAALLAAYGPNAPLAAYDLAAAKPDTLLAAATDVVFTCPTALVAGARVRAGVPVWRYLFGYAPPNGPAVSHGSDLRTVFNAPGEGSLAVGAPPLQAYWVRFAQTGDPNGGTLPHWPQVDAAGRHLVAADTLTVTSGDSAACRASRYP